MDRPNTGHSLRSATEGGDVEAPQPPRTGIGGTYRTLDEQKGRLTDAEERFERARRTTGLFLGPVLFAVMLAVPFDLEPEQHRLAAVLVFVVTYWVTEAIPIPVTALLGLALAVVIGAAPPGEEGDSTADVVFGGFAMSTIFLFIGGFVIAHAMMQHGLARRFAFRVLALPGVGRSTYRTVIAFGAIGALLSAFISNRPRPRCSSRSRWASSPRCRAWSPRAPSATSTPTACASAPRSCS
jgi:di/tricarboxylate transporter